ncbi:MAG TPA: archease [Terriglobales bacterium]|nr:archease [Terriglobales bacterium]
MKAFEEIEHTADLAFCAYGRDPAELFANAARGMFTLQGGGLPPPLQERRVEVEGVDRETLLVNWLNELLYLQERHGEVYSEFEMEELSATRLRARVRGGAQAGVRRRIKAVTFHDLRVRQTAEGWQATLVLDV